MRKTYLFSVLSLLFIGQSYATQPIDKTSTTDLHSTTVNKVTNTFNVRIRLVDINGAPVTGSIGLRGFWARNEQTGVYFDPTDQEGYEFEGLSGGTYTFGAYPGNWEGAVSKTVNLNTSPAGPDGFIEVTLVYWVE